ncbi:MAG: hypothetical protein Tsb0020_29060 [Haliangiales bacterium]
MNARGSLGRDGTGIIDLLPVEGAPSTGVIRDSDAIAKIDRCASPELHLARTFNLEPDLVSIVARRATATNFYEREIFQPQSAGVSHCDGHILGAGLIGIVVAVYAIACAGCEHSKEDSEARQVSCHSLNRVATPGESSMGTCDGRESLLVTCR